MRNRKKKNKIPIRAHTFEYLNNEFNSSAYIFKIKPT